MCGLGDTPTRGEKIQKVGGGWAREVFFTDHTDHLTTAIEAPGFYWALLKQYAASLEFQQHLGTAAEQPGRPQYGLHRWH